MTRHVGFTGTQRGMTEYQSGWLFGLLKRLREEGFSVFHHGDCLGADYQAQRLARQVGFRVVRHPPIDGSKRAFSLFDEERRPKPYLDRNKDIVRETEVLIATPAQMEEILRSGTWSTYRFAGKLGRLRYLLTPRPIPSGETR